MTTDGPNGLVTLQKGFGRKWLELIVHSQTVQPPTGGQTNHCPLTALQAGELCCLFVVPEAILEAGLHTLRL